MSEITPQQAADKGYKVIKASCFEVGLVKDDKGLMSWFCQDFDHKLPELSHPKIMAAVRVQESFELGDE